MDRREAIQKIEAIIDNGQDYGYWTDAQRKALDLAIEALEREIEYGQMVVDYTKGEALKSGDWEYTNIPTDTPTNDYISKQQLSEIKNKAIEDAYSVEDKDDGVVFCIMGADDLKEYLNNLFSIQELDKVTQGDAESATTTDDCISRQAAISIPILPKEERKKFKDYDDAFETGWLEALACVNMLPPVTPTERTGEWIKSTGVAPPEYAGRYVCSSCGHYALMGVPYGNRQELSHFCPNCGTRMKEK